MKTNLLVPSSVRLSLSIIGLFVFFVVLYIAKPIILPLIYAVIFAITLNPLVNFLIRKKMNRVLAIIIALSLVSIIFILIAILLASQINQFSNSFPTLVDKFYEAINGIVLWTSQHINISTKEIEAYIADTKTKILSNSANTISITLNAISGTLASIALIPVYIFMILFYRPMLLEFVQRLFGEKNHQKVNEILSLTKNIIQRYLLALMLEVLIIAALNSIGLLLIGLKYAIILGIFGALLNLIPYLGGLISIILYMVIALFTKDSISYVFYVVGIYTVIQLIDNNLVVPRLIGARVKINALVTIVAVIVGGAFWGISGMFLSIPIIAILKVILDRIDKLKPWGYLLGDSMPEIVNLKINLKIK